MELCIQTITRKHNAQFGAPNKHSINMIIDIDNYKLLHERVKYVQALQEFENYSENKLDRPFAFVLEPLDFGLDSDIAYIFEVLQTKDLQLSHLKCIHFTTLIQFAEFFMVEILRPYIARRFFTTSLNSATKSILWLVQHEHIFPPDAFKFYLTLASDTYGTSTQNLHYSAVTGNWLANFVNLRAHLRITRKDKIQKEKWDFDKICAICNNTTTFDGRGINSDNLLRTAPTWKCNKCDPDFKITWAPTAAFDIM